MEEKESCSSCDTQDCSAKKQRPGEDDEDFRERQKLTSRMCQIKHKIVVLSGKGGVGKSTVAVNLAISLAEAGLHVGLLDADIHGPSVPKLLNLDSRFVETRADAIMPIEFSDNLKVMSVGFMLRGRDDAVIMRGPMKFKVIKEFLSGVEWGELDYLVIDSPPGTGDEPLSICQLIENIDGAVVVTTPQKVALADVRKSINFCKKLKLPVLGVVENMSGFVCPKCGELTEIFKRGGGERMAKRMKVPFLGYVPIDPEIVQACDDGRPYVNYTAGTETIRAFEKVASHIMKMQHRDQKMYRETKASDVNI